MLMTHWLTNQFVVTMTRSQRWGDRGMFPFPSGPWPVLLQKLQYVLWWCYFSTGFLIVSWKARDGWCQCYTLSPQAGSPYQEHIPTYSKDFTLIHEITWSSFLTCWCLRFIKVLGLPFSGLNPLFPHRKRPGNLRLQVDRYGFPFVHDQLQYFNTHTLGRQHLSNSSVNLGAETKEISPWNFCQKGNQFYFFKNILSTWVLY